MVLTRETPDNVLVSLVRKRSADTRAHFRLLFQRAPSNLIHRSIASRGWSRAAQRAGLRRRGCPVDHTLRLLDRLLVTHELLV